MPLNDSVKALEQCDNAMKEIKKQLAPFVRQLNELNDKNNNGDNDANPQKAAADKARAQAVVALSMGTLRYMGARLRGKDEGRKADDPLRQELNQMRKVLVDLEKKRKRDDTDGKEETKGTSRNDEKTRTNKSGNKKEANVVTNKSDGKSNDKSSTPSSSKKRRKR